MSQPHRLGGLGLGTTGTSAIFLAVILSLVVFTVSKVARIENTALPETEPEEWAIVTAE